jgi:NADH-quinone oxidoreductase subunit L
MMIGTLAIAGIFPLSGFFSKDEILYRAFLANKAIWVIAVITAFMTAFYMFRLMAMTFFGAYRGLAWETASQAAAATAAVHGAPHPADAHAHGQAHLEDHEVTHGPAEPHEETLPEDLDDHAAHDPGHGHGPWHGPHESPTPMTFPLMVLAVGAVVAGLLGIPQALGGPNAIEHFLEPSFTAEHTIADRGVRSADAVGDQRSDARNPNSEIRNDEAEPHASHGVERALMLFSLLVAIAGILLARKFYVVSPEIGERMKERFAGAHRVLSHKYYVDELYDSTVIAGTFAAARALWTVDRNVVDGAVNGTGWITVIGSWLSGLTDSRVVDGMVNFVGWIVQESSLAFRRVQTGLLQNYAMLMLFGIFAFVGIYLFVR